MIEPLTARLRFQDGVEQWRCAKCRCWKTRPEMGKRRSRWNGLDHYCLECKAKMQRKRRQPDRPKSPPKPCGLCGSRCLNQPNNEPTPYWCQDCSEPITTAQWQNGRRCCCCTAIELKFGSSLQQATSLVSSSQGA